MKKIILSAILLVGCVAFVNAQEPAKAQTAATEQTATNEFKEVELSSLSETVQTAVKTLAGETLEATKVEFDAKAELTKVTLTNKENKSVKSVTLDKEGKELAAPAAK